MESKNEAADQRHLNKAGVWCKQTQATGSGGGFKWAALTHSALPLIATKCPLFVYLCRSLIGSWPFCNILFCTCKKNILVSEHLIILLSNLFFCHPVPCKTHFFVCFSWLHNSYFLYPLSYLPSSALTPFNNNSKRCPEQHAPASTTFWELLPGDGDKGRTEQKCARQQ